VNVPILGETKKRILLELEGGGLHGYQLARQLDIPVTGIYQHLKELSSEGLIISKKDARKKVYSLTEKGRKLVELIKD